MFHLCSTVAMRRSDVNLFEWGMLITERGEFLCGIRDGGWHAHYYDLHGNMLADWVIEQETIHEENAI